MDFYAEPLNGRARIWVLTGGPAFWNRRPEYPENTDAEPETQMWQSNWRGGSTEIHFQQRPYASRLAGTTAGGSRSSQTGRFQSRVNIRFDSRIVVAMKGVLTEPGHSGAVNHVTLRILPPTPTIGSQ